ncbi:TPA: hypothetical protein ACMUVD_002934 [Enterobacter kobei]|uniref:hypothetical protein n=1 Tax=Enterobacter kobei TaxID=208224 RepID=UPI00388EF6E0
MNNKDLINAGHALAKAISNATPLIEIAKMVSNLATQLGVQIARSNQLSIALEAAEKRIAELEARTLVPVEPTLDQLVAGKRRLTSTGRMSRLMSQRLAEVYRAMVSAAAAGKGE